jgi:hypothetical protein
MTNIVSIFISLLLTNIALAQNNNSKNQLYGAWRHSTEDYIYSFYEKDNLYSISYYDYKNSYSVSKSFYGFNDDCIIKSLSDLKNFGQYYLEVNLILLDFYFKEGNFDKITCYNFKIMKDGRLRFFDNPEQPVYYKKVDKLPANYEDALKKWKAKNESKK